MPLRPVPILKDTAITIEGTASSDRDDDGIVCSNIPVHYDMCALSAGGQPQTIWKYNALMHILIDHQGSDPLDPKLCILPDVPVSMQVKIHIPRAEETALGIKGEHTMEARAGFHLLNSDDFPHGVGEHWMDPESTSDKLYGKRARSGTSSSTIKPPSKKVHFSK